MATGLLIVCTGKYTKKINEYMGMEKEYTGTFTLGSTTPTYDLESEPVNFCNTDHLSESQIKAATQEFSGLIMQVPPMHSAIKQEGKPVYLAARKGLDVVLEPRPVTIHAFEIEKIEMPVVYFRDEDIICKLGNSIRLNRIKNGMSQEELSYKADLDISQIGR